MTKIVLLFLAMLLAGAGRAGWESWLKSGLYRASFEQYEQGQDLDDTGAFKGTWGAPAVPQGADATAGGESGAGRYMSFSTEGTGIAFTPAVTGERALKSVVSSIFLIGNEEWPDPLTSERGGFFIYAPEEGEANSFVGWTAGKWRKLEDGSSVNPITPISEMWYDVSIKYLRTNGVINVQYRIKRATDENYVTLRDKETGETWFPAGGEPSGEIVSQVEYRGEGNLRRLTGSEPRRGLLIGLVPWREMFIDESVYRHDSGKWSVFDYDSKTWSSTPSVYGDAYLIDIPTGENYASFKQKSEGTGDREVIEFAVKFMAPNDNDATPDAVCALVRLVEMPFSAKDTTQADLGYRFACLVNGCWQTNTTANVQADLNVDYTFEVALDKKESKVSYRVKKGRGAESGDYEQLFGPASVPIGSPVHTFFGGAGKVYSIKSSAQTGN